MLTHISMAAGRQVMDCDNKTMSPPKHRPAGHVRPLLFLLLCSCATLTEEERFDREDKLIRAREQYFRQAVSCDRIGGAMTITPLHAMEEFSYDDYRSAKCVVYR